jgi:MFS family permease
LSLSSWLVPLGLMQERQFLRYWWSRICATAASQMLMVAIGWEMYDATGSAWDLGLVGLYQFLPALLLTLPAGHLADKVNRRSMVAVCLLSLTCIAAILALASYQHWVSRALLLTLSVLLGMIRAFQMPAQQSLMPQLVPSLLLPQATAFSSAGTQMAVIAGPALGGFVYLAGAAAVYFVSALLFGLATALMLRVQYSKAIRTDEADTWATVFAGVLFIWRHKVVLGAVTLELFAVLLGGAVALLPIYAKDVLFVGPLGLGFLRSAPAVGALLMCILLTRWPLTHHVGKILLIAVAIYGLSMVTFGLSTSFTLSLLALLVSGMADMVSVVIRLSLVALETPDEMRGRVSAVNSIFIGASNQLGEFESGATAAWMGPVRAVVLGGVGTLIVAAAWFKIFPGLAERDSLPKSSH